MSEKKATIHDIAFNLGITASTVSRALNNNPRISESTRRMVVEKAKELNYQPNKIASALRSGKSQLIGVMVPRIDRAFFSSVIRGIEEVADKLNYRVIVTQSHEDKENEIKNVEALLNARVDGVIAALGMNTENFDHFKSLIKKEIPLVLFDRTTDDLNVRQVVLDDFRGAYLAVEHLIDQGCKHIVHLTGEKKVNIYKERYRGYSEALRDNGIPVDDRLVLSGNMQLQDGRDSVANLIRDKLSFDGIFSASAYTAVGAMQVLRENNISIPEQVAVVGFSNEPFTSFTEPPLTTISQFPLEMGHASAEIFFELLNSEKKKALSQKTVLQPELIIRTSSFRNNG